MGKLYKSSEVAAICNVTTATIHNWVRSGILKMMTFPHGRKKISKEDLWAFLHERGMDPGGLEE